ncbi:hypothetical protein MJO10_30235, partial [Salmonella enterica subsp. enterica serovar Anatum]|nr:hypothetical protein [Salmonella enterica subsp. enterica serovar Anatum]
RFFTVSDAREARKSVFYATGFMGYFYILTFIIGFGAIMLVGAIALRAQEQNPAVKPQTNIFRVIFSKLLLDMPEQRFARQIRLPV